MADLNSLVDRLSALSLLEASDLAMMLEDKWGVSARPQQVSQLEQPPEEVVEEQSEFDVLLTSYGTAKVQVVRVIRGATSLGLRESMELVNTVPVVVKTGLGRTQADELKTEIEAAGGIAEVK